MLNSVLHDWPDAEVRSILHCCALAVGETGRVMIIEEHAHPGNDHAEMDLRMLVLCGGRERTLQEYTDLAAGVGLSVATVSTTPLGQIGIECVPGTVRSSS